VAFLPDCHVTRTDAPFLSAPIPLQLAGSVTLGHDGAKGSMSATLALRATAHAGTCMWYESTLGVLGAKSTKSYVSSLCVSV
jgi:hypothetical protein